MPLQATSGAASYDGFGGGVVAEPNYIESVFSTWLYTGNGSTQTITNGIDLAGDGGMVWLKCRNSAENNEVYDTARGANLRLITNLTNAQADRASSMSFNSNGISWVGDNISNTNGNTYTSWTFRKQPKFFDVLTFSGTGSVQNISHNLGSVPACMIIKDTTNAGSAWAIYHTSLGNTQFLQFTTSAAGTSSGYWNNTSPTSTQFTVGTNGNVNQSGATYVAYLFAHDAGGFGLTETDNVISCGSFTTDASSVATVNLGYEPQWVMFKCTSTTDNWRIVDNMRGFANAGSSSDARLFPNSSSQEFFSDTANPTATGFVTQGDLQASQTYIYIAIRRGPMKVPTDATKVFSPVAYSGTGATRTITAGFPVDLAIPKSRGATGNSAEWYTRLIGQGVALLSAYTFQELARPTELTSFASNTGVVLGTSSDSGGTNASGSTYVDWNIARAPSFMDVVCYTGTGSQQNITHNLGAAPELLIVKRRSAAGTSWATWATSLTADQSLALNTTDDKTAVFSVGFWGSTFPTASVFTVGSNVNTNSNAQTYVAYLFATCAGVQYINSYVGDGTTGRTINCGFTGGARFVCIKATSTTGSWWTFDSARGIVTNNDPALQLNSTAAEVTSADAIDTASSGFIVNQEATCSLNASGVTYLVWAIA